MTTDHTESIDTTARAVVVVTGTIYLQYVKTADELLTLATHALGAIAAGLIVVWWWRRVKKQSKNFDNSDE